MIGSAARSAPLDDSPGRPTPHGVRFAFPEPGSVLGGGYVLEGLIGEWRTANDHLASQPALGRSVAIKVLSPAHGQILAREAAAAARVRPPCSVVVHDAGAVGRIPYLVMDHIAGHVRGLLMQRTTAGA